MECLIDPMDLVKVGGDVLMKKIYSVLVENRSGVLCKVAGLFSRRCFNIDSLAVGETVRPCRFLHDHCVAAATKEPLNRLKSSLTKSWMSLR